MVAAGRVIPGIVVCLCIAVPAWLGGRLYPVVGGPVFAMLCGMALAQALGMRPPFRSRIQEGVSFTAKKILQYSVILLGFGMNLSVVAQTGMQSLPIIAATIAVALGAAYVLHKRMDVNGNTAVLVGVGSAICGGSAIAATAPVINADDAEIAQSVSVIFFFNVLAAMLFPAFGNLLGFSGASGEAFGMFAGTAINDTSSVTAAAATWDTLHHLGSATLDKAVIVKLTRTLAIIPIVLALSLLRKRHTGTDASRTRIASIFPFFILWFGAASLVTTLASGWGALLPFFAACKTASKFLIIMAMAAIGLNSDIVCLVKKGGKPLVLGFACWGLIIVTSLAMQRAMAIW